MSSKLDTRKIKTDLCVIGGGIAGVCAAISAARHGVRVVLMQDRPVLGGNASSEMRMHISGADVHNKKKNMRETGIIEEIRLENLRRNPGKSYSMSDTILYEKVKQEKNIRLLLNTSCLDARMTGKKIKSVKGWQLTTQTYIEVEAKIFADCSGDAILAPLTRALFMTGREGRNEFNEVLAPVKRSPYTMGMTCLFQAEDTGKPVKFEPPSWAYTYKTCKEFPYGKSGHDWLKMGYWWIEMGGMQDTIKDTEEIRDELIKAVYGVWDHLKNHCEEKAKAKNWELVWIQFLPAKRESRRYTGDHVMTANDIRGVTRFPDAVAYGGWPMDDHNSGGFMNKEYAKRSTIFHEVPEYYYIPYRALYSKNIDNLMFAGRCISVTHMALSTVRVMATCGVMGQALGTASSIAIKEKISPREVGKKCIPELRRMLLADDFYIPGYKNEIPEIMSGAKLTSSSGKASVLIDGVTRPVGNISHRLDLKKGGWVKVQLKKAAYIKEISIIFDSMLDNLICMSHLQKDDQLTAPPSRLVKSIKVKADDRIVFSTKNNYQRFLTVKLEKRAKNILLKIEDTWGSKDTGIYSLLVR